ncbi:4230_t:CDS:2 [Funneliformis geosporum]|uniref:4230_t:CDS:1 n=1 Tax=Funneliformis geosporum TaxID=1117311 RepID=A0A9W4SMF4_9GLOM|nr:4230_t:CDS:2 [Funneliformis geosporum]
MGKPDSQNNATCPYLGNIAINKKDRTCQRLKICEFASSELQEMNHVSVDPDSDLRLKMNKDLSTHNVENNTFAVKNDMYALLTVVSEDAINRLFDNIQMIESVADWVIFYRQRWVIASLNKCMSKIDSEMWMISPNNTNVTEAAHTLSNHYGKALIVIQIKKSKSMPVKHKQNMHSGNKKRSRKTIVIDSDTEVENEDDGKENKLTSRFNELEYREKDLALKERELVLREREAKIYVIELINLEKDYQLKLTNTN